MADRSADVLAEGLLDANLDSGGLLAEALCGDPPLLLWVVCTAGCRDDLRPDSVGATAEWLADHLLEVLRWEDAGTPPAVDPKLIGDRVAVPLAVADLAARLAAEESQQAAETAFLLGLLHESERWLTMGGDRPEPDSSPLPRWLADPDRGNSAAGEAVRLAVEVLAAEAAPGDHVAIDLDTCRRAAEEGCRRWLAQGTALGARLPSLAKKLGRLADLENRFQQTLDNEKLEAMAEFAAGAGHEINNPLTVIAGRAQLFLREESDPERRRALALMNAQAMRVYEMIADMMLFARPPQPEPEPIDLVELVDRVIAEFSPRAAAQETTLRRVGESGPVKIEADPAQLTIALQAMVRNSLEAIGRKGLIEIGVCPGRRGAEINVVDDGPGITPEERRHLFDPYFSARQAGRGLGLGLSKAWRIVTNHGGRIEVESKPGSGTRFTVTLPCG